MCVLILLKKKGDIYLMIEGKKKMKKKNKI